MLRALLMKDVMKISVLGCGNVGVSIAADLTLKGHDVTMIKTSTTTNNLCDKIISNGNVVYMKYCGFVKKAVIKDITHDLSRIESSDIVIVTIHSTYHEHLIQEIAPYLNGNQICICICSYMSSFYFKKYCRELPIIAETTGPYIEGRLIEDKPTGVVYFRVGCILSKTPLSVFQKERSAECLEKIRKLYKGFSDEYSVIESALLNPNMVLHTVGSIMSIPRIEYSKGNFCMYREAYARNNRATMNIMLSLDREKKKVLERLCCKQVDIFEAAGFFGNPMERFFSYSESNDRAISPTSVKSRYITEDVSQGLVLMESIANKVGIRTPITSALIYIADSALGSDYRNTGRTIERLGATSYIEELMK